MNLLTLDELKQLSLSARQRDNLKKAISAVQRQNKLDGNIHAPSYVQRDLTRTTALLDAGQRLGLDLDDYVSNNPHHKDVVSAQDDIDAKARGNQRAVHTPAYPAPHAGSTYNSSPPVAPPPAPIVQGGSTHTSTVQDDDSLPVEDGAKEAPFELPVEPAPVAPPPVVDLNVHTKVSFESVGNLFKLRGKSLKGVYMPVIDGARHPKVPDIDPDFFFNYEKGEIVHKLAIGLNEAYNVDSRRHVNSNVWIWGHRGAGKSELINQIGARCNRPVFVTSCHRELTVETLAGEFDPRSVAQGDSVTALLNPEFVQGISTPNAIVVLDELARVQPSNGVGFNGCFERRIVNRQDGTSIKFAQGVTLIVTDNTNGTGDPTGLYEAYPQDASLLDRFRAYIHLPFLPPATEAKVLSKKSGICAPVGHLLVKIANAFRGACKGQGGVQARSLYPSLRGLTSCAEYVLKGVPFRSAIGVTVTGNVIDSDRDVSLIIVDAHAPTDEEIAKVVSGEQSDFTVSADGNDATPADIDDQP